MGDAWEWPDSAGYDWQTKVEPRRKTCLPFGTGCGRCANCQQDRWSEIWGALSPSDRDWVREMYSALGIPPSAAHPSPMRWSS